MIVVFWFVGAKLKYLNKKQGVSYKYWNYFSGGRLS